MAKKDVPEKISITAGANFEPLYFDISENSGFSRSYDCKNRLFITFWDDEDAVAYMELRVCWYPGISNILDISDEDADSEESAATAMAYIKDGIEEDDDVWEDEEIVVCEIHTFYISPDYRGMGLSKRLMLMIPYLLECYINCSDAVVTAYVNPFKNQECTADSEPVRTKREYGYDCADEELLSTMRKALTGIGFEDVMGNGRNYATDLKELASAADNEGLYYYENGDFE